MNPLETQTTAALTNPSSYSQDKDNPFSPKGRFSRLSYLAWMFIVGMLYTCTLFIVAGIASVAFLKSGAFTFEILFQSGLGYFVIFLFSAVILAFTIISICISIRRIHDLDKSGWLWLLFLIPLINVIFGIYIMCAKGTDGDNKYGPQRATEQTEKLLGTLYAVFLAIFIVAYGSIAVWMLSMQNSLNQQMNTIEMAEQDDSNLAQQLENMEQEIEHSSDEIEQQAEVIEESSEAVNQSAEDAVEAANAAAEATESQIVQEANQR